MIIAKHFQSNSSVDDVETALKEYLDNNKRRLVILAYANESEATCSEVVDNAVVDFACEGTECLFVDDNDNPAQEVTQRLEGLTYGDKLVVVINSTKLHNLIQGLRDWLYALVASVNCNEFVAIRLQPESSLALAS